MGLGRQLANLQGGIERSLAKSSAETSAAVKELIPGISARVTEQVSGDIKQFLVGDAFLSSLLGSIGKGLGSVVSGIGNVAGTIIKPIGQLAGGILGPISGLLGGGGGGGGNLGLPAPVTPPFFPSPITTGVKTFAPQPVSFPLPTQGFPLPSVQSAVPRAMPVMAGGLSGLIAQGARTFAEKFPALAGRINAWRAQGIPMTFSKMRGMLRRWGPGVLLSFGILTADELLDLMLADRTIKRRRMNPGNAKALRRSLRRIESFHRLCQRADIMRPTRRRGKRGGVGGHTIITAK